MSEILSSMFFIFDLFYGDSELITNTLYQIDFCLVDNKIFLLNLCDFLVDAVKNWFDRLNVSKGFKIV